MTDHQFRVVADRDKGDDVDATTPLVGDRVTYELGRRAELVRIERPVPTTDGYCPDCGNYGRAHGRVQDVADGPMRDCQYKGVDFRPQHPSVPTREQIAEAIEADERVLTWHVIWEWVCAHRPQPIADERTAQDYVLALLQEGGER